MTHCPRCGFHNPAGFRFCGKCGTRLAAAEVDLEEERRVVSALFCDLAGFTQRAERLDPEDVHNTLSPYYASLRAELERFGGTVEKFIGDAVFALFGAPRAHEDDPERAVRAALAIREAVRHLSDGDSGLDLHLRIGVTTGEAVVELGARPSEGEGMAWGDVLNTAARLQAAAPVDAILVDEVTYRATRHVIEYGVGEPVHAKGKAEPVLVWQALAPLARRGLDLTQLSAEPLVGRGNELALLLESLYRCRLHRAAELVTLVGEPGLGKSRLVLELFRYIETGPALITWRHGRSSPYGDVFAFWALGEIVKGQAGILETDSAATAAEKLSRAVGDLVSAPADVARIEGHLRSLVGLGSEVQARGDQRGAAFAAWRHFLEALARQRPLVLVFEDIQWADDGLLDFLEHLLDWTRHVSILVVCTARPELLVRRRGWGSRRNATTLHLAPLSDAQTAEFVAALARDAALPAETTDAIVTGASGNPLYAVEFVRMLADRGLLAPSEPRARLQAGALPLPGSLQGIIAARLESLSAEERALLQDAAVVGRVVWPGALAAIAGRSHRSVQRRLAALERKEFLARARSSSVEREEEYRFQHVLVREVAYGQIPRARRGEIHRRAAEWLESLSPDRTADRAELLAHHYASALELAKVTGTEAEELTERTRLALREAGDKARALNSFPAAARFYEAALELWPPEDADRPHLLFRLGEASFYAETAGAELLAEARDRLLDAGEREPAAEAESLLGLLAFHRGKRDLFLEHVERAVLRVSDLGPSRSKAEVLMDLAGALMLSDQGEEAIRIAGDVLEIADELGVQELRAHALGIIGTTRCRLGDLDGRADLERSVAITAEINSPLGSFACGNLADLMANLGDLPRCFELQAKALDVAERFGHSGYVRWLRAERVGEYYWCGRWSEATLLAEELIADAEADSPHFTDGRCREMRGRIRLARGDDLGALADGESALEFARETRDVQILYPALSFRARSLLATGSPEGTIEAAVELLELWNKRPNALGNSAWWLIDLSYVLQALGRGLDFTKTAALVTTRTRWLDAATALASQDFQQAAELYAEIGSLPDEALARLRATERLISAGMVHDVDAQASRALSFFRQVGALGHLREAEALLATVARL